MKTPSLCVALLLQTIVAAALALPCPRALATDIDSATPAVSVPTATEQALALRFRGPVGAVAKKGAPSRLGMHVVVRLTVLDLVAHPDSGDVKLGLRSRLLKGSAIGKAPLAVAVHWRF